jgi:hypothetical protein
MAAATAPTSKPLATAFLITLGGRTAPFASSPAVPAPLGRETFQPSASVVEPTNRGSLIAGAAARSD